MLKGKKLGDAIIGKVDESKKRNDGAKKLRAVVDWMNSRNEHLNQGKSHLELITEFNKI